MRRSALRRCPPVHRLTTEWAAAHWVHWDAAKVEVADTPTGLGVVAVEDLGIGELLALIPHHATLRATDLYHGTSRFQAFEAPLRLRERSAMEVLCRRPPYLTEDAALELRTAFAELEEGRHVRGVNLATPFDGERRRWLELALVLALEQSRGPASPFHAYLAVLPKTPIDVSGAFFRDMRLMDDRALLPRVQRCVADRRAEAQAAATLWNNVQHANAARPAFLEQSAVEWAYGCVTSRANNFSFVEGSEAPRPYAVESVDVPHTAATLCPFFDLMNHNAAVTNVLVADVEVSLPPANAPDTFSAPLEPTPCLMIGALGNVKKGTELTYRYNALRGPAGAVDAAENLARFGFVPWDPSP